MKNKELNNYHNMINKCIDTMPSIIKIKTRYNLGEINEDEYISSVLNAMNSRIIELEGEEKQRDLAW